MACGHLVRGIFGGEYIVTIWLEEILNSFERIEHLCEDRISALLEGEKDKLRLRLATCHPYVLSGSAMENIASTILQRNKYRQRLKSGFDAPFYLPLPFDSIWVEGLDPDVEENMMMSLCNPANLNEPERPVFGILVSKFNQNQFQLTTFYRELIEDIEKQNSSEGFDGFKTSSMIISASDYKSNNERAVVHGVLFQIFNEFRSNFVLGLQKVNIRVRVGRGANRKLVQIKDIVRIVSRAERKSLQKKLGTKIDWSHRWEVMGHFRRHNGIGKDQNNHYCVKGRTWVNPHTKGAGGVTATKKTRFVANNALPLLTNKEQA